MGTIRRVIMPTAAGLLMVASPLVGDVGGNTGGNVVADEPIRGVQPLLLPTSSEPVQPDRILVPEGHLIIAQRFIAGKTPFTHTFSPVGTTERPRAISAVPTGLRATMLPNPSDESLGYSRLPLRGILRGMSVIAMLEPARTTPTGDAQLADLTNLSAHKAVRAGNRMLDEGDPAGALQAYRQAAEVRPDTREVPFVQGLAHFSLGEYEQARQAFELAAATMDDALADDAEYGMGTTYHAEALANLDNPQLAVSQFEDAMQRYHSVLSSRRDHEVAREANLKAATMWRQLKQLLEEQEQQRQQSPEQDDNEEESPEEQTQQQDENEKQENDDQQSPQDQEQKDKQGENEEEQQGQDGEQKDRPDQGDQQEQQAQKKEQQDLREQAQRRLREMMQALRQRQKERRETEVQTVPVAPVDKDW